MILRKRRMMTKMRMKMMRAMKMMMSWKASQVQEEACPKWWLKVATGLLRSLQQPAVETLVLAKTLKASSLGTYLSSMCQSYQKSKCSWSVI